MNNLKLPVRLENALSRLYTAYHSGELNAMDCSACAAGNICANDPSWSIFRRNLGLSRFVADMLPEYTYANNSRPKVTPRIVMNNVFNTTGYSIDEIIMVEKVFLNAMGIYSLQRSDISEAYNRMLENAQSLGDGQSREALDNVNFQGLCAVTEYLCELDNVPNVLDYTNIFEKEKHEAKYKFEELFA